MAGRRSPVSAFAGSGHGARMLRKRAFHAVMLARSGDRCRCRTGAGRLHLNAIASRDNG
jgi:hypothetical protein